MYGGVRACMAVYAPCTAVYGRACTGVRRVWPCMAVYGCVRAPVCAPSCPCAGVGGVVIVVTFVPLAVAL